MTSTPTTAARDKLRDAQQRAGDLRARIAEFWAVAESGGEVDAVAVTTAEAELNVADRMTPSLQRLAQAEVAAEQQAAWAEVEADTLARYKRLSAQFLDGLDTARASMTELANQAEALHAHLDGFTGDPRRPPKRGPDGTVQGLLGSWERSTISGVTMHAPTGVDVVLSVAAEEVDRLTNGRGDSLVVAQLHHVRASTKFPADNRKATP